MVEHIKSWIAWKSWRDICNVLGCMSAHPSVHPSFFFGLPNQAYPSWCGVRGGTWPWTGRQSVASVANLESPVKLTLLNCMSPLVHTVWVICGCVKAPGTCIGFWAKYAAIQTASGKSLLISAKRSARNKTAGKDVVPYETENMIKEVLKSYIKQKHLSFRLQILEMITTTYRLTKTEKWNS